MKPVSPARREAMRVHTDRERADVWVLTEAHEDFSPGYAFSHSSAPGFDGNSPQNLERHHWVTIWSRFAIDPLVTSDEKRTAAVRIKPDGCAPFIVYGTVLPWIGSPWRGHPSAKGVAFREALSVQAADWVQLQRDFPNDEVFVLGDFNQDLVSPRYYGSRANRAALEAALKSAGLTPLTAGTNDPVRRDLPGCACIDHICARTDSKWRTQSTVRWPDTPVPERSLSDHFGLAVSLRHG